MGSGATKPLNDANENNASASAGNVEREREYSNHSSFCHRSDNNLGGGNLIPPGTETILPDSSLISQENIRKLIKLEYQRKAFASFLSVYYSELNAQEYLTHCINVEKFLLQKDKSKAVKDVLNLIVHYEKRAAAKLAVDPKHPAAVIARTMESEDKEISKMTHEEISELMVKSQSDIIGMLSPLFAQFMYSPEYEQMLCTSGNTASSAVKSGERGKHFSSRYSSINPDMMTASRRQSLASPQAEIAESNLDH
jgi:hypothetical protein